MEDDPVVEVGRRVRALRAAAALSVAELSRRSGVARATLMQLEGGAGNPTLDTLYGLADALGVPLSELIARPAPAPVRVVRAGEGTPVQGAVTGGRLLDRLTLGAHAVELFTLVVEPGETLRREGHPPGTWEHLIVEQGRLRVGPEEDPVEAGPGDYVAFDAGRPHVYRALGRGPARTTLVIVSPAG
jgi:transcriptional regulator with XRE-family HTH domain